jgi:sugar phosphate isomerase/epimerase
MVYPVAYQLYSSRKSPPLEAQFPALKAMGYDAIEPWLPAYEADPGAFRRALDDNGLRCFGFHMPLDGLVREPNRFIDIALTLGASWVIPPYIAAHERGTTAGFWQGLGGRLQQGAERAKPHGLKVAWHNHDFEFTPMLDGTRPIDHILGPDNPDVWFEIDCGWIARAGADPAGELRRFAGRTGMIQVKDMAPPGTRAEGGWAATGDGVIDWAGLAPLFRASRATHLVSEHDNPRNWHQFAERSINHLRELGL